MQIEKIEWRDSCGVSDSWTHINEIDDAMDVIAVSIGYVLKETEHYVIVLPHYIPENDNPHIQAQGCGDMAIPLCSIVRRQILSPHQPPGGEQL